MAATECKIGQLYRVLNAGRELYLTVGAVYECTANKRGTVGLHRPNRGGGTYTNAARTVVVEPA